MDKKKAIMSLLDVIADCFSSIRGDWTNPHKDCGIGMGAVVEIRELIKEIVIILKK